MRLIMAVLLLGLHAAPAQACSAPRFAYFDFGKVQGKKYEGEQDLAYFIGRVASVAKVSVEDDIIVWQVSLDVLRSYGKVSKTITAEASVGGCTGLGFDQLEEESIGLYAYYYGKDGEPVLAQIRTGF